MITRRRAVVGAGLLVGVVLQGWALHSTTAFAPLSAVAALWWLMTGLSSGPVPVGRRDGRAWLEGLGSAVALIALFLLGALAVRHVPALESLVTSVLDQGDRTGPGLTLALLVLGGVAEELFFRGAVPAVLPTDLPARGRVLWSTAVYAVVMAVSGNAMLVLAAVLLGLLTGWLRERLGGVLVPAAAHVTWTAGMFLLLPLLLG